MPETKHEVKDNDHLPLLATLSGFKDWRSLWHLNGELQSKRKNPFLLFHGDKKVPQGDVVTIPDTAQKQEPGATDAHHPFQVPTDLVFLRLRVLNEEYQQIKDATWQLFVDGVKYPKDQDEGQFEAGGMINVQVPKTAQKGKLKVKFAPSAAQTAPETPRVIEGNEGAAAPTDGDTQLIRNNGQLCPHYPQSPRDSTGAVTGWGTRKLGTGSSISAQGCAITSVAMILKYFGRSVDPGVLDEYLDTHNGYSGNSVYWDVAFKCGETTGGVRFSASQKVTSGMQAVLDDRIKRNLPTIASVDYGSDADESHNHFVVIVGKTKDGYVMNDPASSGGNGAADPSKTINILEKTTRQSGYKLLSLRFADPDTPVTNPTPAAPPQGAAPAPPAETKKEEPKAPPPAQPVVVEFVLQIGKLNPIQEQAPDQSCLAGTQQRLNNLGFDAGTVDGDDGPTTQGAIKRFQRRMKLTVNGKSDAPTQKALYDIHDQPGTPPSPAAQQDADAPAPPPASSAPAGPPPAESTSPPASTSPADSEYKYTLDAGHELQKELEDSVPGYRTSFNGYGGGANQYVCTTYAEEVLKRSGYNITADLSKKININNISASENLEQLVNSGDVRTKGVVNALVSAGLGTEVAITAVKPGDFVQYWYHFTKDGVQKLGGHTGQVEKVNAPGKVDFHGSHGSEKGVAVLKGLNLTTKIKAYAVHPKGNPS